MSSAVPSLTPSLAWMQQHEIPFMPSLMPRINEGKDESSSIRDDSAESFQRQQVWTLIVNDLSLLLRLSTLEFYSHTLYNKSLHRFIQNFLTQIETVWKECGGKIKRWEQGEQEGEEEEEKKQETMPKSEAFDLIRAMVKKVLLVYVRVCTIDSSTPLLSCSDHPSWLTPTFFTTSFSASSLFSPAALIDLVQFYSAVDVDAHRPLLQHILDTVWERLPYAFTTGMTQAFATMTAAILAQVKLIHAPYVTNSTAVKKARFVRDELKTLVRNLTSILFAVYSMCRLRPELLRLLIQGLNGANTKSASSSSSSSSVAASPATPPFLAVLTTLYTLTPLLLLHELGVKYAQLSGQVELLALRKGVMVLVRLIFTHCILPSIGVKGKKFQWRMLVGRREEAKSLTSSQATTASTLPAALSVSAGVDVLDSAMRLMFDTPHDDAASKDGLCFIPTSMKNLVCFNTASTQNALLKRYNEYFELDTMLMFLREQSIDATSGEQNLPGAILGRAKIDKLIGLLHTIDAPLIKDRIGWPLPQPKSASSSSSSSGLFSEVDGRKAPPQPSLSKSSSKAGGVDLSLAISAVHDLFPHLSTDYISACLSEFNGDVDATTDAILMEKLPQYLQDVKDKGAFRAGDQQDARKLKGPGAFGIGAMSRQSSTGSGMLDQPVDDEDELIDKLGSGINDGADDEFEAFLKRTGRVSKQAIQQQPDKKLSGAAMMLNNFSKEDALLIANKITASMKHSEYDDEYDDGFDDFEFALDATPLELEEDAAGKSGSLYDSKIGDGASNDVGDEPDGQSYQPTNKFTARGGMRGGRGGASSSVTSRGGRGASSGGDATRPVNYDTIQVPRTFRPDPNPSTDVREQWRRDEERKEVYIATIKAQKAQQLAPSKRTAEQAADYEHGLRHGLIQNLDQNAQKGQHQKGQQQKGQQQQQQPQPQQQPHVRDDAQSRGAAHSHSRSSDPSGPPPRGAFSARGGGRSGARGGADSHNHNNSTAAPAGLSASAATFQPRTDHQQQTQQRAQTTNTQQANQQANSHQSQSSHRSRVPDNWEDASSGSGGDSGDDAGGAPSGGAQSGGQPLDLRARKRKEQNKARSANHNRKAMAAKKQGIRF